MTQNTVNDRQVGGDHYSQGGDFQHWDIVEENGIGYLEGCATKYIARCRNKNGLEDLKKAEHYVQKLIDMYRDTGRRARGWAPQDHIDLFCERYNLDARQKYCMEALLSSWAFAQLILVRDLLGAMSQDEGAYGSQKEKAV